MKIGERTVDGSDDDWTNQRVLNGDYKRTKARVRDVLKERLALKEMYLMVIPSLQFLFHFW